MSELTIRVIYTDIYSFISDDFVEIIIITSLIALRR